MASPSQNTETLYRSCPTCEASCGLQLEIDRDTQDILRISGDSQDHRSQGYVCAKSQAFHHIYKDPERLRRPVKRNGDSWQEISWEQAFDEICEKLGGIREQYGKDSIAMYYGNPNGHNYATGLYTPLFINMLNTERFFSAGSVDQQPKNLSCELLYGDAWMFPIPDIQRSDFFVCMGGNPLVSQGSLMSAPNVKEQLEGIRQRGGKLVVVDPRRSETAEFADRHLFIRPGTDTWLLLSWVQQLFAQNRVDAGHLSEHIDGLEQLQQLVAPYTPERTAAITGVSAQQLLQLIDDFANADAPVLYGRIGLCTQAFGTLASWLVDIVNLLQGRLDSAGGAMFPLAATQLPAAPDAQAQPLGRDRFRTRVRDFPEYMNMMPASLMGEELEYDGEDRARALITVAGNPVLTVPDGERVREACKKLDLIISLDFYINETTSLADYILPSTSQLEHSNYELLFQTTAVRNFARYSPQILKPEPGARHQYEIMLELVARLNSMNSGDLDAMMLQGLIDQIRSSDDFANISAEHMQQLCEQHEGPERYLDLMLRAGPHGDGFDEGSEGLNLKRLKQAAHGIDLGPLKPRLPHALKTAGKRIQLVPELLAADMKRLEQETAPLSEDEFLLIGRRHIRDMNSWLHNIPQYARGENRCTLRMHPLDAKRLGLSEGDMARLQSPKRDAQAPVEISDEVMPGVVSLPHGFGHRYKDTRQSTAQQRQPGISANDLIDENQLDMPSGTSVVNGAKIRIQAA